MFRARTILFILLITVSLSAEVNDKWKINLGGMFVTNFNTEMQLGDKDIPLGLTLDTEEHLGMKNESSAFRLDGYYRFTQTHSVDISYFRARSDGYKSIDEDIEFDGKTIGTGAILDSYFYMDVYKVSYGYSFYHNDKVELMLTAGLHITSLDLGLYAEGTITDNGTATVSSSFRSSESITVPLPAFGFKGEYTIIDETLFVSYKADIFLLKFDDYKGSLLTSALNLEYRFIESVGVGVGYNANDIYVKADDGDKTLEVENRLSGLMVYLSYIY